MILFFKKIRLNLLSESKTSKYFKYAIGETVLIVIGILIALQINNWNEGQKEQKQLMGLLKKIGDDISLDMTEIANIKIFRDSSKYYSHKFFEIIKRENLGIEDWTKISNPNYNVFFPIELKCNKSGYNLLLGSGLLNSLNDSDLESAILDYYEFVEQTETIEQDIYSSIKKHYDYLMNRVSTVEAYDYFYNDTIKEEQNIWFRKFIKNPSLSGAHFANIDDIGLQNYYSELIEKGNHILELLNSMTYLNKL